MQKKLGQTPSQTVGPFFAYGLTPEQYGYTFSSIAGPVMSKTKTITITGHVYDGAGDTIPDAMVEIWQADKQLFGRCGTGSNADHHFYFETEKPNAPSPDSAPHLSVVVFMRGLLVHAYTRIYFADHAEANAKDPVLQTIPEARRKTLIATTDPQKPNSYLFNIHMQGSDETVFFDI